MDITKLMLHPIAAAFTADIPGNADVVALADTYARLVTHGDYQSHCQALGIEWHLRTAAQVAFHDPAVLGALNTMESALEGRKRAHMRILRQRGR